MIIRPYDISKVTELEAGIIVTVVAAAIVPGTANCYMFGVGASPAHNPLIVEYSCRGSFTACTGYLQSSFDGGVTFGNIGPIVDIFANPRGNLTLFFAVAAIVPGVIYRFNLATLALNQDPLGSISIDLAVT